MEEGTKEVEGRRKRWPIKPAARSTRFSTVVRQSAELVQEISLASKQQVRRYGRRRPHAMQIISNITRQTSQGTRGTVANRQPNL